MLRTIGNRAFLNTALTDVVLPEGLQMIDQTAFSGAARGMLRNVVIPSTVTSIGSQAFYNHANLASVTFTEGGTEGLTIGSQAFQNLKSLTSITFPSNLEEINSNALRGSVNIESISIPESCANYVSQDGILYSKDETGAITGLVLFPLGKTGSVTVPEGVTEIASYALNTSKITDISLPSTLRTIGTYAFQDSAIETITMQEGVTSIGNYAFEGSALTSIAIPASVTSLGNYSFSNCVDLTTVTFGENSSLTTIGQYAFGVSSTATAYTGITSITIPKSVTSIGARAFNNCQDLETVIFEEGGTQELTMAAGGGYSNFNINAHNSNYGVFGYCISLTEVTLPFRLRTVPSFAFVRCTSLKTVNFATDENGNYGVTTISNGAFRETAIETFVVPDSVTTLTLNSTYTNNTFAGCDNLRSVTLPAGIGEQADFWKYFHGSHSLEEVNVSENNNTYASVDGVVFSKDLSTLIYFPTGKMAEGGTYEIPAGTETIGDNAFYHYRSTSTSTSYKPREDYARITGVVIPASVSYIGEEAFRLPYLETITFAEAAAGETEAASLEVGASAFSGYQLPANNLTSIALPARLTELGSYTFRNQVLLTSVTFAEGCRLNSIGSSFSGCSALESITLPDALETIGSSAFSSCSSLTSIVIPDSVTEIGGSAFSGCSALTSVVVPDSVTEIGSSAFNNCSGLTSVTLSASLTEIGNSAFVGCTSLTSITIPASVESIGYSAFRGCTALSSVTFEEGSRLQSFATYRRPSSTYGVFSGCTSLTGITLPESLQSLHHYAFYGCTSLREVDFGANSQVTSIDIGAFSGCTSLEVITLPRNLTTIGESAFTGCTSLMEVEVMPALVSIGTSAFSGCSSLETFTVYGAVTEIGANAFSGCDNLSVEIDSGNTAFTVLEDGILYDSMQTTIISLYGELSGEVVIPGSVTSIPAGMFAGSAVTKVTLPAGITEIAEGMFEGCENLEEVVMLGRVTSIGANAFADSGLERITIGRYVTSIGEGAFRNCSNLTEVTFEPNGSSILQIADYAFQNCTSLTSIDLPVRLRNTMTDTGYSGIYYDVVEGIGAYAFDGCANLASVTFNVRGGQMLTEGLSFGDYAFRNTAITSMVLPTYLRGYLEATEPLPGSRRAYHPAIGSYCFDGCAALQSVTFNYHATESYYIGNYAFRNCTSLSELVNLPSSLSFTDPVATNACGTGIFQNCTALTEITLPSQSWYGSDVFAGCTGLTKVTFYMSANTGSTIGLNAFSGCTALSEVVLPENLTLIRTGAFAGCTALTSITLPASVTTVQAGAFEGWTASQTISVSFAAGQVPSGFASGWSGGATVAYANASALAALPGEGKQ